MSYESLSAGAAVVAAREARCPQSIEIIIRDSRTSLERGWASARKIRLGLDLVESYPPGRQNAVQTVLDAVYDELAGADLRVIKRQAEELLRAADARCIGPGTTRLTVATAAVYVVAKANGARLTQNAVVAAVSPFWRRRPGGSVGMGVSFGTSTKPEQCVDAATASVVNLVFRPIILDGVFWVSITQRS